jgi:hypothetical protein
MPGIPSPAPAPAGFRAALTGRAKRRLGVAGKTATVGLQAAGFEVRGEISGGNLLAFSRIAKVRVGFEEARWGVILLLRVWLREDRKPYTFGGNLDRRDYGRFVRAAVAQMLRDEPQIPIETGAGFFTLVFVLGAFSAVVLGSAGLTIYLAAAGEDWTMPLGALALFAILLAFLGPWVWSRYRPRRIARLEEIERALPTC